MRKETAMTWGKPTATLSAELETELARLRSSAPPPQIEDPIYKYLKRAYRLRVKADSSPDLQKAIKRAHARHCSRTLKQYGGVIVELTVGDDVTRNMKNKYVTTIEYFSGKKLRSNFIDFVKEQGGLNRCTDAWRRKYGRQNVGAGTKKSTK
jgi:hypothetical protein